MESQHSKKKSRKNLSVVSLFTSYGLGDLGVREAGGDILAMAELDARRCEFLRRNHPDALIVEGDLKQTKDDVVRRVRETLGDEELFLVVATPPCQGNSSNGKGRINKAVREGKRSERDLRNELILPALDVIKRLRPLYVVIENTRGMDKTNIPFKGRLRLIPDVIREELGSDYVGVAEVVKFSRYGVGQNRERLITIFTRDPNGIAMLKRHGTLLPSPTHARPITLREAIGDFEELDGRTAAVSRHNPLHRVKKVPHYDAIDRTPEGRTAFDNQCSECGFAGNPTFPGQQGPHCPSHCDGCGRLLPRPMMSDRADGRLRILICYKNGYKRMCWDRPAPTVTCNFMTASSADNLHPDQNRTLSPAEAIVLQTVDRYDYDWGERPTDDDLRFALGEAVPPLFFEKLTRHLADISTGSTGPGMPPYGQDHEPRPATRRADPSRRPVPRKASARRQARPELNGGLSISKSNGVRGVADAACSVARNRHGRAEEEKK
jgi:DNA (cytosine-5)-methyltransferase 1